jgi:stage II sporulation protein P
MALAVKLTAVLEKLHPGITRPISLRKQQFNQDLCPGALIVEVGAAGNTHAEAETAIHALAEAILALSWGANDG